MVGAVSHTARSAVAGSERLQSNISFAVATIRNLGLEQIGIRGLSVYGTEAWKNLGIHDASDMRSQWDTGDYGAGIRTLISPLL